MNSVPDRPSVTRDELLQRPEYADIARGVQERAEMVTAMFRHAQAHFILCTEESVSRHYDWFYRWHIGIISTGYLLGRTGLKRSSKYSGKGKWI